MAGRTTKSADNVDVETLQNDLKTLKADFAKLAGLLGEQAQSSIQDTAQQAKASVQDAAQQAKDKASESAEELQEQIRDNPFASVMIALGVGFILGKLLDR